MVKYESECNECAECIGCGRKYQKYIVKVCDSCGEEVDELYKYNGEELCIDCIADELESV